MLPEGIPTVKVTGRFLTPAGQPLAGQVVFRGPGMVTFGEFDVILGGAVTAPLDANGAFEVELPATDAPGMNPSDWSYSVAEQLTGVSMSRTYQVLLPAETPAVDLADIAPTDPTTPTYVAVRGDSAYEVAVEQGFAGTVEQWLASLVGDQGPQGETGAPGSQVYTGTTAPAADLGVDGDVYTQHTTTTALGVTTSTVALWSRTAGAWARVGGDVRGAAWYINDTGTPSAEIPLGDMLLRVDSGDVYQRAASGWELQGNIKGPQGAQGVQGAQGPAGAPGVVQSVNGVSAAAVVLDAAAVGAVPDTAPGAANGVAQLDASGKVPTAQLPDGIGGGAVETVNGKSPDAAGNVALVAADVGALATTARGAANGVASLGGTSKVLDAQLPYDGWRPTDLGMKAWAFEPATAQSGGRTPSSGSFRIIAVPVRETITVSSIVFHVMGYEGTGLDTGSRAGIFNASGTRLAQTADMADTAVMIDIHNAGGQTVTCALTAPVTLSPGVYYVCFRFVIGTSANAPVLMTADSTSACPVVTLNSVKPFGVISSMGSWPASFSTAAIETDPIKFWAALA
ncbi:MULTISPECIES: hypothetical protein [unclassified Streptomyces]|uniref:hypothetical protein n=1 Tax=unclassified Streptomyces TaxID=2593676 RepID=UPI00344D018C